jgi:hypothetical protein
MENNVQDLKDQDTTPHSREKTLRAFKWLGIALLALAVICAAGAWLNGSVMPAMP